MAKSQLDREIRTLERELAQLRADVGHLAKDTGKAARQVGDTAQEAGAVALAKLQEEAARLLDSLKGAGQSAVEGGEGVVATVHERIDEHPLVAAAAALGIGFAVGMLLARRG
jgi:ElaB/YqjD/DUF883 family membrane-anchored ribosome-binding protein